MTNYEQLQRFLSNLLIQYELEDDPSTAYFVVGVTLHANLKAAVTMDYLGDLNLNLHKAGISLSDSLDRRWDFVIKAHDLDQDKLDLIAKTLDEFNVTSASLLQASVSYDGTYTIHFPPKGQRRILRVKDGVFTYDTGLGMVGIPTDLEDGLYTIETNVLVELDEDEDEEFF